MNTYVIICGNSVIFGMTEDGLIKEVRYLVRAGHTSMEILTDDEWKARKEGKE